MSLIITIRTTEGAIMASDSRTTWSTNLSPDKTLVGIHFSDTANKLFLVGNRYGISTCGEASIRGRSISAWMDDLSTSDELNVDSVKKAAEIVARFFCDMRPMKAVLFHITGYEQISGNETVLSFYKVIVSPNGKFIIEGPMRGCGASWDGETSTMYRLIKDCFIADASSVHSVERVQIKSLSDDGGVEFVELQNPIVLSKDAIHFPEASIRWRMFTLQEAIDFAVYAIRTTIATMRFQSQPITVGEPIDLLVIKPKQAMWLSKKDIHMS